VLYNFEQVASSKTSSCSSIFSHSNLSTSISSYICYEMSFKALRIIDSPSSFALCSSPINSLIFSNSSEV